MAQHDYDIANDTAANVRADINNVLEAIVSNNSGASEPSTTYANQWWYDSSNDILKIRNEADTAWIDFATVNQTDSRTEFSILYSTNISDGTDTVGTEYVINGSAKAWVTSDATATIQEDLNVSSATDDGTGLQTFNLTNSFTASTFSCLVGGDENASRTSVNAAFFEDRISTYRTTSSARGGLQTSNGNLDDPFTYWAVTFWGDLA